MVINPNNQIKFLEFTVRDGYISFFYETQKCDIANTIKKTGHIFFELSPNIRPHYDLIALALSTLCGKNYNSIYYDLKVSPSIVAAISKFTNSNVSALQSDENTIQMKKNNNISLNFSGGFDSLSAKCLMPKDTNLVSIDLGGKFSRERVFFSKFSTCILKTNLLETTLNHNSWSFLGIASILFNNYLNSSYYTFGSTFISSINNLKTPPPDMRNISFPPFLAAGMENAPFIIGLTEVSVVNVLSHYAPDLIGASLDSLANVGEEKRARKQLLCMIASDKLKKDFNINIINHPKKPYFKFGEDFETDFLIFYFIKNAGLNEASYIISDIPNEVIMCAKKLSLNFYERLNTNFLVNFPKQFKGDLLSKLSNANIIPYTETDWQEFHKVKELLYSYHKIK